MLNKYNIIEMECSIWDAPTIIILFCLTELSALSLSLSLSHTHTHTHTHILSLQKNLNGYPTAYSNNSKATVSLVREDLL